MAACILRLGKVVSARRNQRRIRCRSVSGIATYSSFQRCRDRLELGERRSEVLDYLAGDDLGRWEIVCVLSLAVAFGGGWVVLSSSRFGAEENRAKESREMRAWSMPTTWRPRGVSSARRWS